MTQTKNDVAWNNLFEQHSILEEVERSGAFVISSAQINLVRESRLMAKFDHSVNLPDIFKKHQLAILPVSRSQYIIGHFDTYMPIKYDKQSEPLTSRLPLELESIDYTNLYSEASVLLYAYNAGLIMDVMGEPAKLTVMGRMTTGEFDFRIRQRTGLAEHQILVSNAQCEVDAGFEGTESFLLIEAKNYSVDDFIIRQLYYPYRRWHGRIGKRVIPALMTYSNDTINFFVFQFDDLTDYNSLRHVFQKRYLIAPESITNDDLDHLIKTVRIIPDEEGIPFPQADRFERIIDLITQLFDKDLSTDEITASYQFDARQTDYYTNAARYLRLIEKQSRPSLRGILYSLTHEGLVLLRARHKAKILGLIKLILEHKIFHDAITLHLSKGHMPSKTELAELIQCQRSDLNSTTAERRTSTVSGWLDWILSQVDK